MVNKLLLITFSMFLLQACFDSGEGETSGGGLFANHEPVEETTTQTTETTTETTTEPVDTIAPSLSLDPVADVNLANVASYSLGGSCDEAAGTVHVSFGALSTTTSCDGVSWIVTNWDVSAEPDAVSITVSVNLSDAAGNPAVQQTDTAIKDTTIPNITLTTPADGSYINIANDSASFAIAGTCDDASASYDIQIDAASVGSASCDGANLSGSINSAVLSEAAHTIQIIATDTLGNTASSPLNNFTRDITAPIISSVTSSATGVQVETVSVDFSVNFSESVVITSGPRLDIVLDTELVAAYANCAAGSAASATCSYIVDTPLNHYDQNGIVMNSPLDLNTGSITDLAGNVIADLTFSAPDLSAITVNNVYPEFQWQIESSEGAGDWSPVAGAPQAFDFGTPGANVTRTFRVLNHGTAATSANFTFTIANGGGVFSSITDNCSGQIIPINGTCTISIQFKNKKPLGPKSGSYSAQDAAYTNNPGFLLNLSGTSI